jgi:magnesium-transporting ATPase (P-type)
MKKFGDNTITTTKYNILTWFPKSLVMQFKRIANIYFLMISVLTLMPFSPKNPYTQTSTFVMVLLFTMLKEAYEDFRRYKQDKDINYKKTNVYDYKSKQFNNTFWYQLKAGDIIKVI